jgi:hypothetical protein
LRRIKYLGHIISAQGVQTDPSKIQDIVEWKTPTTVTQLRGFLGLTGYYRRFVKAYVVICKPLHEALKKNSFKWAEDQEASFKHLNY